jgi:assimilatory nitrate reductase catalytic subunit
MFQAAADGEIKALWIACTNPAQSMPDQATVRRALERAEFVVVQEAFATAATCAFGDLLLPATTWGEKEGTVTNSERRISRVRAAVPAPGQAKHDWAIATLFAQKLARKLGRDPALLDYTMPQAIWNEHRESTRGRDLDITGLTYATLETDGPQQWPYPTGASTGLERLYADGQFPTPDGKARFVATAYQPVAEVRESRYPFSLTTGRLRDQWHGMTRTGTLGRLFSHVAEPCLQMHPQDMRRRQLANGDLVHVTSKRGSILVPVQSASELGLNQVFMAMHWGPEYLSGQSSTGETLAGVNALTTSAYCPDSKQPELKHAAVKVLKAEMPWTLLGMAWLPADRVLAAQETLRGLMGSLAFTACVPFSNNTPLNATAGQNAVPERSGILFRAAAYEAPPAELITQIEAALRLQGADILRYADPRKGQHRAARLVRDPATQTLTLEAVLLCGDTRAEAWIKTLLQDALPAQPYGRMLLSPGSKPPVAVQSRGKVVCSCFNVTDMAIAQQLQTPACQASDDPLAVLQGALKCGTNCGSCIPELKKMVRAQVAVKAVSAA